MPGRQAVRPAAVAAVAVLLAGLALVALTARSGRTETVRPVLAPTTVTAPPNTRTDRRPDESVSETPKPIDTPPANIGILAALVAIGVLTVVGLFMWIMIERTRISSGRFGRYRTPLPSRLDGGQPPPDPTALVEAVEAGLRDLEQGDPGEGVVACWVQLERAAEDAGAGRAAPETPSELAGRLIDTHGVEAGPLVRLAELYREARYSAHPVREDARTEARSLLEAVRADLALATASHVVQRSPG